VPEEPEVEQRRTQRLVALGQLPPPVPPRKKPTTITMLRPVKADSQTTTVVTDELRQSDSLPTQPERASMPVAPVIISPRRSRRTPEPHDTAAQAAVELPDGVEPSQPSQTVEEPTTPPPLDPPPVVVVRPSLLEAPREAPSADAPLPPRPSEPPRRAAVEAPRERVYPPAAKRTGLRWLVVSAVFAAGVAAGVVVGFLRRPEPSAPVVQRVIVPVTIPMPILVPGGAAAPEPPTEAPKPPPEAPKPPVTKPPPHPPAPPSHVRPKPPPPKPKPPCNALNCL
jgi:hypothetical protein